MLHNRDATASMLITPDWSVPSRVRACTTTRIGGVSQGPYAEFNLAAHVGDDPHAVAENRAQLVRALQLPEPPRWLDQVHGTAVVKADTVSGPCAADAAWTDVAGVVCAVQTADCLPVLLCDPAGTRVAAAHAGWRGLAAGVIEATVAAMRSPGVELLAWLGPAIGPEAFEVGDEVRVQFIDHDAVAAEAFSVARPGHWFADIYALAHQRLRAAGVTDISGGGFCTWRDDARFYSYRRDQATGRMATLIWLQAQ